MKKLFSNATLDAVVVDELLRIGAKPLDGDDQYRGVTSVGFDADAVMVEISKCNQHYGALRKIINRQFVLFEDSQGFIVPLSMASTKNNAMLEFFESRLASIKIKLLKGADCVGNGRFGDWQSSSGEEQSMAFHHLLLAIDAADVGLIESLCGSKVLGKFEQSFDMVRMRKKDDVLDVSLPIYFDRALKHQDTGELFVRLAFSYRSGSEWKFEFKVLSSAALQDGKRLLEEIVNTIPSVPDRKLLTEYVRELLKFHYVGAEHSLWLRREGWLCDEAGPWACVLGSRLLTRPSADLAGVFAAVDAPRFVAKGTLDGWNSEVLSVASQSPMMLGALQIALASIMLDFVPGVSAGVFNFCGGAGRGKTLLLSAVASLLGRPFAPGQGNSAGGGRCVIDSFSATSKALQAKGQQLKFGPMLIDEIGSNDYGCLDSFVYSMANGSYRDRLNGRGELQEAPSRSLFVMTNGEVPILDLIAVNAKKGVLDRACDIDVGGEFSGDEVNPYELNLTGDQIGQLARGFSENYGCVAPEFAAALLAASAANTWDTELQACEQELLAQLPEFVNKQGTCRIVRRFALAVLAGRVALNAGVLSSSLVDREMLFEGVFACVHQWMVTRWKHLDALSECLLTLGSVHFGSPASGKNVFRHKTVVGDMPTIMIRREWVSYLFPSGNDADLFIKRLAQDGMLVRMEPGRHTVGKDPHYHLRLDWLPSYSVGWSDDEECFVTLAA